MKKFGLPHRSIILGFGTTGVLMIALFFLMTNRMVEMFQDIEFVVHENNTSIALATEMRDIINRRQISLRNIYIYSDYFDRDEERLLFYGYAQPFIEARDKLQKFLKNAQEQKIFSEIKILSAEAYPLQNDLIEKAMTGISIPEVEDLLQSTLTLQSDVIQLLTQLLVYRQEAAEMSLQQANETYKKSRLIILSLGGATALLVLMIAIQVSRRIQTQTRRIQEVSKMPIENPSPVIRVKNDGTILFVNEASYCLLHDWECSLGEKVPLKWQEIIRSMDKRETKKEMIISCQEKIFSLTIAGFANEGYVNFYGKDITESETMKKKIAHQASHDSLTGLINRREFENQMEQLLANAQQYNQQHALLYMDLDKFKIVNDTSGHAAGDKLLKEISQLMLSKIRSSDSLARLGGDEFGVLLSFCSEEKALKIANAILQAVRDYRLTWKNHQFDIGISIGVISLTPDTGSLTELLSAADSACYRAKKYGRNRICSVGSDNSNIKEKRGEMEWVRHITEAIENDRFVLYFQEIVPYDPDFSDTLHGEVLLRMQNKQGELIYPNAFLKSAERYGLMNNIDRWVIRHCLDTMGAQHASNSGYLMSCSINLSAQSLSSDGIIEFITDSIIKSKVRADLIVFEITETTASANIDSILIIISELKKAGCKIALDDFGKGLNSFSYLKDLNVDYIKIDGSFSEGVNTDPANKSIIQAINQVGHAFDIKTIAKSVESKKTSSMLRQIGVDFGQGNALHEPKELEMSTKLMRNRAC